MEELDWSAETSGVTFNADLEPKTPNTNDCTYGYSHFRHFQNWKFMEINKVVKPVY